MRHGKRTDGKPRRTRIEKGKHPLVERVPGDGPGHPEVVIDHEALFEAALTHASFEQLGRIFGVSGSTLSREDRDYRGIILKARATRQKELLSAQFSTAITDRNPTMQIWLGKQYLDQKDVSRVESTGPDGGPQKHELTKRRVIVIPGNGRDG